MKTKFLITVPVLKAVGFQHFKCEAENEKDALKKWNDGSVEFFSEEIEAIQLGKPEIIQL